MSDFTLAPAPFLGGYAGSFPGAELAEVTDHALVSIAVPLGGAGPLGQALQDAFGASFPAPGATSRSRDGDTRILGLAPDQALAVMPRGEVPAVDAVKARLGDAAWCTDQTDAWVLLRLTGPAALAALERICPLDLHPDAFPEGRVARTVMEHLGVIVLREGPQDVLLMSASSSARSFLHAVEVSIRNVTRPA